MVYCLVHRSALASAIVWTAAVLTWASPAAAQGSYLDVEGVDSAMRAVNDGEAAWFAYEQKEWDRAYDRGMRACNANNAKGCVILGEVLAEGRLGSPDLRGAETAHRKAARLYSERCGASAIYPDTCSFAGDFHAALAVPALKNPRLAKTYYTRARDLYADNCDRSGYQCYMAGFLTDGDFSGKADPAAAARLWRRGCDDNDDDADAGEKISSCNLLVERLAYGPVGVQNQGEARRRIEGDQCSAAGPGTGGSRRVNRQAVLRDRR